MSRPALSPRATRTLRTIARQPHARPSYRRTVESLERRGLIASRTVSQEDRPGVSTTCAVYEITEAGRAALS